jgi:hypothetical protein
MLLSNLFDHTSKFSKYGQAECILHYIPSIFGVLYNSLDTLLVFNAAANILLQKRSYYYEGNHITVSHSVSLKSRRSTVTPLNDYRRPIGNVKKEPVVVNEI